MSRQRSTCGIYQEAMEAALNNALGSLSNLTDVVMFELSKLKALVRGYHNRYADDNVWRCLSVEEAVRFNIPQTDMVYVGMIDTMVENYGETVMVEHKTIGRDVKPSDAYFQKLAYDGQVSLYHLAKYLDGNPIDQTIYDVVRKLTIKPKRIPAGKEGAIGTKSEIEEHGTYYGHALDGDGVSPDRESPALFELRCLHEVDANPDKYFIRLGNVVRSEQQMAETLNDLVHVAKDIEQATQTGAWYQNTTMCEKYGSPCEFMTLCRGVEDPENVNWEPRKKSDISADNTLSYSGMSTFLTCRRKYYWRYIYGIQRRTETPPALAFGKAFHLALENWWQTFKAEQADEHKDESE